MRVGICQGSFNFLNLPIDKLTAKLKKIGFDCYDYGISGFWACNPIFNDNRDTWVKYFSNQRNMIEGEGMCVNQTHAVFPADFDKEQPFTFTQKVIDQLKREIEATAILGAKYIVIHPIKISFKHKDKEKDFHKNVEEFSKITPILQEFGIKNCMENLCFRDTLSNRFSQTGCSTPEDMLKYIDTLNKNCNNYCACLDVGHSNLIELNPADAVRKLKDKLEILHVNDNNGIHDQHKPIGMGIIDWKDFAKSLKEIDYQGVFSLEVSSFRNYYNLGEKTLWKMVEFCFESAKDLIENY